VLFRLLVTSFGCILKYFVCLAVCQQRLRLVLETPPKAACNKSGFYFLGYQHVTPVQHGCVYSLVHRSNAATCRFLALVVTSVMLSDRCPLCFFINLIDPGNFAQSLLLCHFQLTNCSHYNNSNVR
jgi:hypothetical protein